MINQNLVNKSSKKKLNHQYRIEDNQKEDVDNDYKYSRENYYNLIERGPRERLKDHIRYRTREGQHPRVNEVIGQLINQLSQNEQINYKTYKKTKRLKRVILKSSNANIKTLFV